MPDNDVRLIIRARLAGAEEAESGPPEVRAYAFDARGTYLGETELEEGRGALEIPGAAARGAVRVLFGPPTEPARRADKAPRYSNLKRRGYYERRLRVDVEEPRLDVRLVEPVWRDWLRCRCVVRGRLVQRMRRPDGTLQELPVCNARVTICEVDRLPWIIHRLPDRDLFRLRDDILDVIDRPIPQPDPGPRIPRPLPEPFPPLPDPRPPIEFGTLPPPRPSQPVLPRPPRGLAAAEAPGAEAEASEAAPAVFEAADQMRDLARFDSAVELRRELVNRVTLLPSILCLFPWFELFVRYRLDCLITVPVDEEGRFEATITYPCFGDRPDLYFSAEQLRDGAWRSIYRPTIRCNTWWNYACGSEVVLVVTDPSVEVCVPEDPVEPPPGVGSWILPLAVGGTRIWGQNPVTPAAPAGWVKASGYTDYGGFVDAPFGGRLALRHGYSNDIPNGIRYYRWSYRRGSSGDFTPLAEPVHRRYVRQVPGMLPSFPAYSLGPNSVGSETHLFEFRPASPPAPDPGDPAGTTHQWPTENFFGDIYSGYFETPSLPPSIAGAAGQYQVKLEVFDASGTRVDPGAGTFRFIVSTGFAADGITLEARQAQASEIDNGGFVFHLQVDNNSCSATIYAPAISGSAVTDECGFLRYNPASAAPVTISYRATHPNDHAEFDFSVIRATHNIGTLRVDNAEVGAAAAGVYTKNAAGNYTDAVSRITLLCEGPPPGCCENAAFSENLYVFAKATRGWGARISAYDASAVRAFALATQP